MQSTTHRLVDASSGAALGRLASLDGGVKTKPVPNLHKNIVASCDVSVKAHSERRFLCQLKQAVSTPSI